jgi:2-methylcitrate dehydratase PrpD
VGQAQFAAERVMRADVQSLLAKTDVIADPELTKLYPAKFPARVTVTLKNGQQLLTRHTNRYRWFANHASRSAWWGIGISASWHRRYRPN